jgi:ribosomal protein S18 acetylase RimI-like enzyme
MFVVDDGIIHSKGVIMLKFKKLTSNAFKFYMQQSINKYAEYIYQSKEVDSMERALKVSHEEVLPWAKEALISKDHYLYRVKNAKNDTVGWIWYEMVDEGKKAFLVYIFIDPKYRGRGLAGEVLEFFEQETRARGAEEIVLYVFKLNTPAIKLYKKNGYAIVDEVSSFDAVEPTRYKMTKSLGVVI